MVAYPVGVSKAATPTYGGGEGVVAPLGLQENKTKVGVSNRRFSCGAEVTSNRGCCYEVENSVVVSLSVISILQLRVTFFGLALVQER